MPLWLQIAGLIVGVLTGIAGTVLGIINLVLRWRDKTPRLEVAAEIEPGTNDDGDEVMSLFVAVRNKGSVPVKVTNLYFKAEGRELRIPEMYGSRKLPFWMEPGDVERFEVVLPFMFERMHRAGFEGQTYVSATATDGLGNTYESKPFHVDLTRPHE